MGPRSASRRSPLFALRPVAPEAPHIDVHWFDRRHERARTGPHGHHFLELLYFERGGGSHRMGAQTWEIQPGDLYLVAPGEIHDVSGVTDAAGWVVHFAAALIAPDDAGAGAFLFWQSNPLLHPFARSGGVAFRRFAVPAAERPAWVARLRAMQAELDERRPGYREAARAHLLLLLVDLARLAADVPGVWLAQDEPVLAAAFAVIDARYAEPLGLAEVAAAVGLTPGYLTTLVRRRTGRTVVAWLTERRLAEARRLLTETDQTAAEVASQVGYADPTHFIRAFRRAHGLTPAAWRRANR